MLHCDCPYMAGGAGRPFTSDGSSAGSSKRSAAHPSVGASATASRPPPHEGLDMEELRGFPTPEARIEVPMTTRNAMLFLFVAVPASLLCSDCDPLPQPQVVVYHCTCRNGGSVVEFDQ